MPSETSQEVRSVGIAVSKGIGFKPRIAKQMQAAAIVVSVY